MQKFCQAVGLLMLAIKQRKQVVRIPRSKLSLKFFYLFYKEGLIKGFTFSEDLKYILIFLKYVDHLSLIKGFRFISKPSRIIYLSKNKLIKFFYRYGFFLISTSNFGFSFLHNYVIKNILKTSGNFLIDDNFICKNVFLSGGVLFFQLYI